MIPEVIRGTLCVMLKTESLALRVTVPPTTTAESELPSLCSTNRLHAVLSMGKSKVQRLLPWYGPLAHSPWARRMFGDTGNMVPWGPTWDRLSLLRAFPPVTVDETFRCRAWVSFTAHRKLSSPVRAQEALQVGDRVPYLVSHLAA